MRGFRPEWARKLGERKARECGFDSFPIDPFAIAADEDIFVEEHKAAQPGVSGGIIFDGPNVGIFYSTAIRSPGFHRFTIGHELGHYFLPGHPEELQKVHCMHRRLGSPQAIDLSKLKQITFRLVCFSRESLFATPSTMRR